MLDFRSGGPLDACDRCSSTTAPVVELYLTGNESARVYVCIVCLANSIDAVTGWKLTNNVIIGLAFPRAVERFRSQAPRSSKGATDGPSDSLEDS